MRYAIALSTLRRCYFTLGRIAYGPSGLARIEARRTLRALPPFAKVNAAWKKANSRKKDV